MSSYPYLTPWLDNKCIPAKFCEFRDLGCHSLFESTVPWNKAGHTVGHSVNCTQVGPSQVTGEQIGRAADIMCHCSVLPSRPCEQWVAEVKFDFTFTSEIGSWTNNKWRTRSECFLTFAGTFILKQIVAFRN